MKIFISNLGPVREADIELTPLTIFVGPNNSGKSFIATILHAALSRSPIDHAVQTSRSKKAEFDEIAAENHLDDEAFDTGQILSYDNIAEPLREFLSKHIIGALDVYGTALVKEIERATGASIHDLRRVRKRATRASLRLEFSHPAWTISVAITGKAPKIEISPPELEQVWSHIRPEIWGYLHSLSDVHGFLRSYLLRALTTALASACFSEAPSHTKYLPAARSGLMQSHKVLSGSLVRRASLAGIEDMKIPAMSGVVTDFLGEMIEVNRNAPSSFQDASRLLETEILHGEIILTEEPSGYPEVFFRSDAGRFSLSRTSSMISELAPIVIYLRYIVSKGDLLFIEEPEAHLHPQTQIIFARLLAQLVNDGLLVGLTTHSEFFLQQLNNSIVAGSMASEAADESGLPQETRLQPNRVGAYLFEPSQNGTVARKLTTNPTEGIPGTGFDLVTEQLYNQAVALEQRAVHAG